MWKACWLLPVSTLAASCSLLFDPSEPGRGTGPDAAAAGPVLLSDDFEEGELRAGYGRAQAVGNSCEVSSEQAYLSEFALRCSIEDSGGSAAVFIDVPPTDNFRVEMDVLFAQEPPGYLTFVEAVHLAGVSEHPLVSMSYLYEGGGGSYLNFHLEEPEAIRTGNGAIAPNAWIHVDFGAKLADDSGYVYFDVSQIGKTEERDLDTLNVQKELVTRLRVGVSDVSLPTSPKTIYIDNLQITREL